MKTNNIKFLLITLAFTFTSCGTFKKVVHQEKESEHTESSVDAVTNRTITETTNTVVTIPEASTSASGSLEQLCDGDGIVSETDGVKVEVKYNPKTKQVNVKGTRKQVNVPVNTTKKTIEQVNEKRQDNTEKKTVIKDKDKKINTGIPWQLWLLLLILAGLAAWYLKRKYWPG